MSYKDLVSRNLYQRAPAATLAPSVLKQALLFGVGVILPLISFRTGLARAMASFSERVTPVDMLVIATILILFVADGIRLHLSVVLYAGALIVAMTISMLWASPARFPNALTASIALLVVLCYWVLGYNVSRSATLTRALLAGVVVGVLWEAVIVVHDYFAASQWFIDPMSGRVRGTFRASGQLGAYGFSSAGLLLALGWPMFQKRWVRGLIVGAGVLAMFFVIAASRRTGILALCAWVVLILLLGLRRFRSPRYWAVLAAALVFVAVIVYSVASPEATFLGSRLSSAVAVIGTGESYPEMQLQSAMQHVGAWFPLGLGLGRGITVMPGEANEIHNGHLALLVEAGVFGLVTYYWLAAQPFFRKWGDSFGTDTAIVQTLVLAFLLAAAFQMIHGTLHRDRGFMLLLGLAANLCAGRSQGREPG